MTNYWDDIASEYHRVTQISCDDFHYGPLLPGDRQLGLLPKSVKGLKCLELGCGAGQNSIYLARQGAICTAVDTSAGQIAKARELAAAFDTPVHCAVMDMEHLPAGWSGQFDLIHSSYALPFAEDQRAVVREAARCLQPAGTVLVSTAHPLFAFEWADFEDGNMALLVENYYCPPADIRRSENRAETACRPVAVSCLIDYFHAAGLLTDRLLEPQPLPLETMSPAEIDARVPYYSEAWHALYPHMQRAPAVLIVKARPA